MCEEQYACSRYCDSIKVSLYPCGYQLDVEKEEAMFEPRGILLEGADLVKGKIYQGSNTTVAKSSGYH